MNITSSSEYRMTPIGPAKFCYVSEKDTQFDSNGIYHVSLELTKVEIFMIWPIHLIYINLRMINF